MAVSWFDDYAWVGWGPFVGIFLVLAILIAKG